MRKGFTYTLMGIAAALVVFAAGLFCGRNMNHQPVEILVPDRSATTQTLPVRLPEEALLNINTATADELTQLPGIGEVLAGRIVAYREENGAFTSIDQLTMVSGIGAEKFRKIAQLITVGI